MFFDVFFKTTQMDKSLQLAAYKKYKQWPGKKIGARVPRNLQGQLEWSKHNAVYDRFVSFQNSRLFT